MERTIRRVCIAWLGAIGGAVLTQQVCFPGSRYLGYGFLVAAVGGIPVVMAGNLWLAGVELRDAWWRMRVLRRATKWKWPQRREHANDWLKEWWEE
jgi:hypothetical protein